MTDDAALIRRQAHMMNAIRKLLVTSSLLLIAGYAVAGEHAFTQSAFDSLNAAGAPNIVYFHATWCPTCKIQQPIVDHLAAQPELKGVTILEADFDKEVALKRALKVSQQSTFVVFKGGREVARSTGQTREQDIKDTFAKAL
jgi:thioredoxin 1